jgi:hypothetical protein
MILGMSEAVITSKRRSRMTVRVVVNMVQKHMFYCTCHFIVSIMPQDDYNPDSVLCAKPLSPSAPGFVVPSRYPKVPQV